MEPRGMMPGVDWVGAVDWDRRTFDELVPLPEGTSYNAYLVHGTEKTVLFDGVDPSLQGVLADRLKGVDRIDYLVAHHAEQDHAGTLPWLLERYPAATVLTSKKGKTLLIEELHVPDGRIRTVEDGETLDLGGRTVEFWMMPWVHWPETFVSFLREDRVLLTCDLFGSHLATSHTWVANEARAIRAARLYYAQIMMPFAPMIARHLDRLAGREIAAILPSHGPAWPKPSVILDAYREWVSAPPKNLVVIGYVSMHGSTKALVDRLVASLTDRGPCVRQFNLAALDTGELAMALIDAATIVLGTPTVNSAAHPHAVTTAYLANLLKPKAKWLGAIGSYGWSPGKSIEQLQGLMTGLKAEWLPPVMVKSLPRAEDLAEIDKLADLIALKHAEAGI